MTVARSVTATGILEARAMVGPNSTAAARATREQMPDASPPTAAPRGVQGGQDTLAVLGARATDARATDAARRAVIEAEQHMRRQATRRVR